MNPFSLMTNEHGGFGRTDSDVTHRDWSHMQLRQTTSFTSQLHGGAYSSNDVVTAGPGSIQDFCEQPTLTGGD
jgi:hypothetical protein